MLVANLLMIVGALAWLAGELFGVYRNLTVKNSGRDTTSQWVWFVESRVPVTRVLVGVFVLSLFAHFMWGTYLLP